MFDRKDIKPKLEKKDINQYKSIDELKSIILPLVQQRDTMTEYDHLIETVDKYVQKNEATWLYKSNNYCIYHPISFYSSNILKELYGGEDHVDVCTVTGKNYFSQYSNNGYLIYIIEDETFFVSFINQTDKMNSEFSDKLNASEYDLKFQLKHFPPLQNIIQKVITDDTSIEVIIKIQPDQKKQYEFCVKLVSKNGTNLSRVPYNLRDKNLSKIAVKNNSNALDDVPLDIRDSDICNLAVANDKSNDCHSVKYVPKNLKDVKDVYMTAVSNNGNAISNIPIYLRDYDLCLTAVKNYARALHYVPLESRDYKMCLASVKNNGISLQFVPTNILDYNLCEIAINNNPTTLHNVPNYLKDYDLCKQAVSMSGSVLSAVPDQFKNYEICLIAVSNAGHILWKVPNEFKDYKLCKTAVENNEKALADVPPELQPKIKKELGI